MVLLPNYHFELVCLDAANRVETLFFGEDHLISLGMTQ